MTFIEQLRRWRHAHVVIRELGDFDRRQSNALASPDISPLKRATESLERGAIEDAYVHWCEARRLKPQLVFAARETVDILLKAGREEQLESELQWALANGYHTEVIFSGLAALEDRRGCMAEAARLWAKARTCNGADARIWLAEAYCLGKVQKHAEQLVLLRVRLESL